MKCAEIREALPAYVEDRNDDLAVRRHLSRCPECRAELELYGSLRDDLSAMRLIEAEPPSELLGKLTSIPTEGPAAERVRTHVARHRSAYAGGLAIAVVGAAGAALWRSRRSRLVAA
jgi:anti-sigma factor RsiW